MDENTTEFEAFAAAFNDAEDYQTDGTEETAETEVEETAEDVGGEDQGEAESGEESEDAHTSEDEEEGAEADGEEDKPNSEQPEQTFTLRVNKEDKQVSLAEMTTLAQKGADYDRVKGQLTESRQEVQNLQAEQAKYKGAIEALETLASGSGMNLDEFVEQLQIRAEMQGGMSEGEAKATIRAKKAEKQLDAMKAETAAKQQQTAAEDKGSRAEREVAEFRERFPDVELTEQLCKELMADVRGGMTLVDAYQKREQAQAQARIKELEQQLEAEKQNKRNRRNSPGSQRDSGGKREKSEFDEFAAAFR